MEHELMIFYHIIDMYTLKLRILLRIDTIKKKSTQQQQHIFFQQQTTGKQKKTCLHPMMIGWKDPIFGCKLDPLIFGGKIPPSRPGFGWWTKPWGKIRGRKGGMKIYIVEESGETLGEITAFHDMLDIFRCKVLYLYSWLFTGWC